MTTVHDALNLELEFTFKGTTLKILIANSLTSFKVLRLSVHVFERRVGYVCPKVMLANGFRPPFGRVARCHKYTIGFLEMTPTLLNPSSIGYYVVAQS